MRTDSFLKLDSLNSNKIQNLVIKSDEDMKLLPFKSFENIVATNATIPTKFQTVIISHDGKKGFLSKSKRFEEQMNENPGPGKYLSHINFESSSTSYSKKGTGGLASKTKRNIGVLNSRQQGGSFILLPSSFNQKQDFNRSGNTRIFQKEIAKKIEAQPTPAPNQYKININPIKKSSTEAGFQSQTKREMNYLKEASKIPAPSQYSINYNLVQGSAKAVSYPFKSRSKRSCSAQPHPFPGPGSYDLDKHLDTKNENRRILRKHYLCLSAPALQLPSNPPYPGPGTYNIPSDFEERPKQYMSSSAFVSTTGRWYAPAHDNNIPGPAYYHLAQPIGKQSFLLNANEKWI